MTNVELCMKPTDRKFYSCFPVSDVEETLPIYQSYNFIVHKMNVFCDRCHCCLLQPQNHAS